MKKFVLGFVLATCICVSCITVTFASNTYNSYYFVANNGSFAGYQTTTYEALANMAADAAQLVGENYFDQVPQGASVRMVWAQDKYVVAFYNASNNVVGWLGSNTTHMAYCAYENQATQLLDHIDDFVTATYNVASDIRSYCSNISTKITSIDTRLISTNTSLASIDSKLNYLTSLDTFVETTLNNNIVANGTAITTWGQAIIDALNALDIDDTGIINALNTLHSDLDLNNDVAIATYNLLKKASVAGEDEKLYVAYVNTGVHIPYSVACQMVAELNNHYKYQSVRAVTIENNSPSYSDGGFMYATIDTFPQDGSGGQKYIKVTFRESSGYFNSSAKLAYYHDNAIGVFIVDDPVETTAFFDDTNIVNAINRIYDWLDSADLATNATIQELVTEVQGDYNASKPLYNKIIKLFKHTFGSLDDNFSLSDFGDAVDYMDEFWSLGSGN